MDWSNPQKLYEDGLQACPIDTQYRDKLLDNNIVKDSSHILHLVQQNPGNGKRATLWRSREKYDEGAFEQESQTTGDCTSHGDRNARDVTRSVEIDIKGEAEEYYKRGATEPTYGYRGHSGQGMDPARAAYFVTKYGFMVRKNYENCVDLSKYKSSIGNNWGRSGPPKCVLDKCSEHSVGEYVTPSTADEAMALFHNGYACHSGQNVGFNSTPSSRGIHEKSGSWNHDMSTVGYDDTKEIWKVRVYFVMNSWGKAHNPWQKWYDELTPILGRPLQSMLVVDAEVWERYFLGGRSIYFYSNIKGFPKQTLPNYGTGEYL